jgi:aspartate aminotransferase
MTQLSQLAETLIGSEIVKLGNEIKARISQGEKIYNYTIGDFDPRIFPIPEELKSGIIAAYHSNYTNYPPADGLLELRRAVAAFINREEGIEYKENEILIAAGGRPLIYSLFRAVVSPGDKVIYPVPSWNNNHYVHMNGGTHCVIETLAENNFMPTAAQIAPHLKGAALLCLCSPQNPTGTTITKAELEKICDLVLQENNRRQPGEKKLYLMFDQMYFTLTYGETKHYNPVSLRDEMKSCTIFIDGISKAFAATGVRVGWSLGPPHVIAKMKSLLSHIGAWSPMAEQKAVATYLYEEIAIKKYLTDFKEELEERLWMLYKGFMTLKAKGLPVEAIEPQAAIYLTVKIDLKGSNYKNHIITAQQEVTEFLLQEARLAIVPFYAFGADPQSPWYRMSIGTCKKEEIIEMLGLLERALSMVCPTLQ